MKSATHISLERILVVSIILSLGALTALAAPPQARLFEGMGPHARPITTESPEAQEWFNHGLNWKYAFNHAEAIRCFQRAAELDDHCAMAWWGISLAAGPEYNDPVMTAERTATAWNALQKTLACIDERTTPVERALIEALKARYAKVEPDAEGRAKLNKAYAAAMRRVWQTYPNDADVGTLFAEALMVVTPWQLYELEDGTPRADTPEIVRTLTRVVAMEPEHPGAMHLYIHAVEPSRDPGMALFAADRLSDLVPASGHMLHMPCHIYVQTGQWDRAIVQSEKAMRADNRYDELTEVPDSQYLYIVHNSHMLAFSAMMIGREREAMACAREMWADVPADALPRVGPVFDMWMCSVYDVQKRFGRWDDIIAEPAPPKFLPITQARWRAARAVAYAAKKDFEKAEDEYRHFRAAMNAIPRDVPWGYERVMRALKVSNYFIPGEIALQRNDWNRAAELLEKAAAAEDLLQYDEPPEWLQPVRHTLGAVYLKAGKFAQAERAYREDLTDWPGNGWSLFGLSRALDEQGKTQEAAQVMTHYHQVWARADEMTTTSCKCIANP
jgi:tetratricopeptide (TPR) repeat protein